MFLQKRKKKNVRNVLRETPPIHLSLILLTLSVSTSNFQIWSPRRCSYKIEIYRTLETFLEKSTHPPKPKVHLPLFPIPRDPNRSYKKKRKREGERKRERGKKEGEKVRERGWEGERVGGG